MPNQKHVNNNIFLEQNFRNILLGSDNQNIRDLNLNLMSYATTQSFLVTIYVIISQK